MLHIIEIYFLLFIIYSFLGWTIEVIGKLIEIKKFVNRGFLIGPCCVIYGTGAMLITFGLKYFAFNPIVLFFMSVLICGVLEYLTSYVMEKLFNARWWDYSNRKFNINGRVCLYTIIPFGLMGCFVIYIGNPFFIEKLQLIPDLYLNIISLIILIIFIADYCISFGIISNLKKATRLVNKENILDNTEEITKKVKEILLNKSIFNRRIVHAYPRLVVIKIKSKIREKKEEIQNQVIDTKEEIQKNVQNVKKIIDSKVSDAKKIIKK